MSRAEMVFVAKRLGQSGTKLHRQAHVAVDRQATAHEGCGGVDGAVEHSFERVHICGQRYVCELGNGFFGYLPCQSGPFALDDEFRGACCKTAVDFGVQGFYGCGDDVAHGEFLRL